MTLPPSPLPDTHYFDEDTDQNCWSHSPAQLQEYAKQVRESTLEEAVQALSIMNLKNASDMWIRGACVDVIKRMK